MFIINSLYRDCNEDFTEDNYLINSWSKDTDGILWSILFAYDFSFLLKLKELEIMISWFLGDDCKEHYFDNFELTSINLVISSIADFLFSL